MEGEETPDLSEETDTLEVETDITEEKAIQIEERVYQRVNLVVSGILASKIADIKRGVLIPLSRSVGDFSLTIEIDVSSTDGISETTLENQIKETIRQIGAHIDTEKLE